MHWLVSVLTGIVVTVGGWFSYQPVQPQPQQPNLGSDTQLFLGGVTYNLAGSGISSSATSFNLTSLTLPQNGYKIQDSDLSSTFYVTLEPGNRTRQEFASCTTVTQNSAGTATLSGCTRGLAPLTPYTASSTLQFAHAGGTQIIFSNPPQLYDQAAFKGNDESITGTWTFSLAAPPTYDFNPSTTYWTGASSSTIPSKAYVDSVAVAGASNANETTKGIVELATQIEAASSTAFGSTAAALVLQAKYATSSPYTPGLWNVQTQNDGTINPIMIATSSAYSYRWTAANVFAASTTLSATTTIAASNASTTALVLNSIPYSFPGSNGASSTVLTNNGWGRLSWNRPDWVLLFSTTTTGILASTTIPNLPAATDLKLVIDTGTVTGVGLLSIQFNGDTAANYNWRTVDNFTPTIVNGAGSVIRPMVAFNDNTVGFVVQANITNIASRLKTITGLEVEENTGAVIGGSFWGNWTNTSNQISSITIGCGGGTGCPVGMQIRIYGSNQ